MQVQWSAVEDSGTGEPGRRMVMMDLLAVSGGKASEMR